MLAVFTASLLHFAEDYKLTKIAQWWVVKHIKILTIFFLIFFIISVNLDEFR